MLGVAACKSTGVPPSAGNPDSSQARGEPQPLVISDFEEPPVFDNNPALRFEWQQFIADGRYRLARVDDMRFSDPAKHRINESFGWWQIGHPFDRELAAIVVDKSRSDPERFGVIVFRPVYKGDVKASYTRHWLFRERDLSKTALSSPSGYLFVSEFGEGESFKTCEVRWSGRRNTYVCLPMKG
jgi:hypothetical protein